MGGPPVFIADQQGGVEHDDQPTVEKVGCRRHDPRFDESNESDEAALAHVMAGVEGAYMRPDRGRAETDLHPGPPEAQPRRAWHGSNVSNGRRGKESEASLSPVDSCRLAALPSSPHFTPWPHAGSGVDSPRRPRSRNDAKRRRPAPSRD